MSILDVILLIVSVSVLIFVYVSIHKEFNGKKKLTIKERIAKLEAVAITPKNLVTCESCGCAVFKDNAKKGKSEVKTIIIWSIERTEEEYIYTPYYCKGCYQDYLKKIKEKK